MIDTDFQLLPKQEHAVYYLKDTTTSEIVYGGAAGGGKSALGCLWLIEMCTTYAGSRWMMGRSKLDTLKSTTLKTFFELASKLGISSQFTYNENKKTILWDNGSEIVLQELDFYPKDPEYDRLGSLEICGAFIDEIAQIRFKAWQVVKSRCRYKLAEFGIIPKVLGSCNPTKNWVYSKFYKAQRDGKLKPYRKFVVALPKDNPHLPPSYLQALLEMDAATRERLYYGNWEYDDDPNALCEYDDILAIFHNDHQFNENENSFITCDPARKGKDKAVVLRWIGWTVVEYKEYATSTLTLIQELINSWRMDYKIPHKRCIADEDGVGGGVVDNCKILGFVNNSTPLDVRTKVEKKQNVAAPNYNNLQSQCGFLLAEKIRKNILYIKCALPQDIQDNVVEELEQLKEHEADKLGKKKILPKDIIKQNIHRSPDWRDALLMRAYFDISKKYSGVYVFA